MCHWCHPPTAVAGSDCTVVPVDRDRFLFLVSKTPYFALEVMEILALRLRNMNLRNSIISNKTRS